MRCAICGLGLLWLLAVSPAAAQVYQWEDKDGTVHATMDLNSVPPEHRAEASRRAFLGGAAQAKQPAKDSESTSGGKAKSKPRPRRDFRTGSEPRRAPGPASPAEAEVEYRNASDEWEQVRKKLAAELDKQEEILAEVARDPRGWRVMDQNGQEDEGARGEEAVIEAERNVLYAREQLDDWERRRPLPPAKR